MREIEFKTGVIRPVECMKEGWELIKDQYWLFFGITFVGMLLGGVTFYILLGAMYCGIYYALLQKMNGRNAVFEDLFKGFQYFGPSLVVTLVLIVPVIVFIIISWISMFSIMFSMTSSRGVIEPSAIFTLYGVMFGEGIIFAIFSGCIHALIMFAYPLIIERNLSGIEAFKLSAKAVWNNLSGVVGLILTEFALGFIGYLACGIGLYFVFPIMFAGVLVAYRKVFPPLNNQFINQPPPPYSYQEAGNYR